MKHFFGIFLFTVLSLLYITFLSCNNYKTVYLKEYKKNREKYHSFLCHLDSLQKTDKNIKLAIIKRNTLPNLQLILTDTTTIFSNSFYFSRNSKENSNVPSKYINTCEIFYTLNCQAIEYFDSNLFIALGANKQSKNLDVESGLLLTKNNKTITLGTVLNKINDSVFIFEKRIF